MPSLTVLLPTIGRPSLAAAVTSVLPGLRKDDELIVVADAAYTPHYYARGVCKLAEHMTDGNVLYLEADAPGSSFGNGQRDAGIRHVHSSHLLFLDDDDVFLDGALSTVREAVTEAPSAVHVFKAKWGPGHHAAGTVLWADKDFRAGNVGTPMVCWPMDRWRGLTSKRVPLWMDFNSLGIVSDFGWMNAALADREPVWHEETICEVRP